MHPHTHTHSHTHAEKYVKLIAFPQQKLFRERASMLRYAYIACLVCFLRMEQSALEDENQIDYAVM
jgi:hypothetical protein